MLYLRTLRHSTWLCRTRPCDALQDRALRHHALLFVVLFSVLRDSSRYGTLPNYAELQPLYVSALRYAVLCEARLCLSSPYDTLHNLAELNSMIHPDRMSRVSLIASSIVR